jgi:hypothetical protein
MSASALLAELRSYGFQLRAVKGHIGITPFDLLTSDQIRLIRMHKPELLSLLAPNGQGPSEVDPLPFTYVTHPITLEEVVNDLKRVTEVGLDTETTGLDPRQARVRLLQLAVGPKTFILDLFALGDVSCLWGPLSRIEVVGHNLQFDLGMLWPLGFRPGAVYDLMLMSRLLTAGGPDWFKNGLEDLANRFLNIQLNKTHQKSDWSVPVLSVEQLKYAGLDARVTLDLRGPVQKEIETANLQAVAVVENQAVPAFVWMASAGVGVDSTAWLRLAEEAEQLCIQKVRRLDELAPQPLNQEWNWGSPSQVREVFGLLGFPLTSADVKVLNSLSHPLAALVVAYRKAVRADMTKASELAAHMNALAPPRPGIPWNWRSSQQVKKVLSLCGANVDSTGDEILAMIADPPLAKQFAVAMREHRTADQAVKSYGRDWRS